MPHYEIEDKSVEMTDATTGEKLGFHPVVVIEADSGEKALAAWIESVPHKVDRRRVQVRPVGDTSDNDG